jgi:hypothetical protein
VSYDYERFPTADLYLAHAAKLEQNTNAIISAGANRAAANSLYNDLRLANLYQLKESNKIGREILRKMDILFGSKRLTPIQSRNLSLLLSMSEDQLIELASKVNSDNLVDGNVKSK